MEPGTTTPGTDATTDTDKGLYFDQQWQRALEVDPEFIFVTGWNEWTAGQMNRTNPDYAEEMKKWDFFPGAKCGKGGREVKMGEGYFIDPVQPGVQPRHRTDEGRPYRQLLLPVDRQCPEVQRGCPSPNRPANR